MLKAKVAFLLIIKKRVLSLWVKKLLKPNWIFVRPTLSGLLVRFYEREQDFRGEGVFLFRARVVFKCLQAARALLCSRLSPHEVIFCLIFLQEHSNPQSRHALGASLANPALSSHHPAGAPFSQLPFPPVHHSLFPMMPPGLNLSAGPFSHQNKNAHSINDMGPPMFSVRKEFIWVYIILYLIFFCLALNLGVPGQNSNQGTPASMPYEGFNPDALLAPASRNACGSKSLSKFSTPVNNYVVPTISAANRPDSPNKKKMINMVMPPASLNSQQSKSKPASLSLSNSHMLLTTHQSTSGVTTGNNSSGTKSAFSVVVPPASSSNVKVPAEDGDTIISRNMYLKDGSNATIDVLHSINNSNNQFRTTTELLSSNNLHWKQTSSVSESVTNSLQNSYTNTSGKVLREAWCMHVSSHYSINLNFLVFCVSVSRLQSSGKPYNWKPFKSWYSRGREWSICCYTEVQ